MNHERDPAQSVALYWDFENLHAGLADADRALDARYTRDGVHPTSDGFDAMEAILRPYLKRYLR